MEDIQYLLQKGLQAVQNISSFPLWSCVCCQRAGFANGEWLFYHPLYKHRGGGKIWAQPLNPTLMLHSLLTLPWPMFFLHHRGELVLQDGPLGPSRTSMNVSSQYVAKKQSWVLLGVFLLIESPKMLRFLGRGCHDQQRSFKVFNWQLIIYFSILPF